MKLIADSGSTKTTWCVFQDKQRLATINTQGINPFHQDEDAIKRIITDELEPQLSALAIESIEFYGAGCTAQKIPLVKNILKDSFRECKDVVVDSDLLGAAKALYGDKEGIACILGTGANSCLYDGERIVQNVSPMGYILGDEGSGAVIGKNFVNALYKGGHDQFKATFEAETGLKQADIIQRVYRETMPNRFLASLCPFIKSHIATEPWIEALVVDCFREFFRKNIVHYSRRDLQIGFVGSIAYHFTEQLKKAAELEGYCIGTILKEPLA